MNEAYKSKLFLSDIRDIQPAVPIEYSVISLRARVNLVPLFKPIFIILVVKMSVIEQERDYDPMQVYLE